MPRPSRRGNGRQIDLTLFGAVSDMELLAIVDDLADENGWTRILEVRLQIGENVEAEKRSGVPSRLSWMRRYGWLEADPPMSVKSVKAGERRFRLTQIGHTLLDNPSLSKAMEGQLARLNPAQRLVMTRELAEAAHSGAEEIRTALRRQWNRSMR